MTLPTFADVLEADRRIRPLALVTPLLRADALDQASGGQIFVKADCLQPRGAFKMRGAANAMLKIPVEDRAKGVVAFSSGNHAQGIACVAKHLGMSATIVVPSDAPKGKLESVEADGGKIVIYDRVLESREAIGAAIAEETGATLIPPFDHPDVIAGQGTCGLEIINQVRELGLELDVLVSCASGGGLAAGIGLALEALSPATQLIGAEPVSHDDLTRSLALSQRVANEPGTRTIQDALMTQIPGELTFEILSRVGTKGVAVSDDEVLQAMAFAFKYLRIVLEPGGAAALAAVLSGKVSAKGQVIAVTGSGGNVDPEIFMRALAIRV
ncbi:MAG: threonine/serine dehydratase [Aquidulcibacter sp.]|uniref:threonine ammonia-lyase n=1 Tax=Aquidulcibacter sp. TaxID=2052990 RepID=UPI0022BBAC43|nr:threonine/serine dehydratase [Aquidulcibacter sp.]